MQALTIEQFGGLDLVDDPSTTSGAIDMLNVDIDRRGRIRTRDGFVRLDSVAATGTTSMLTATALGGADTLLHLSQAGSTVYLDKVSTAGVRTAVGNWLAVNVTPPARIGTPTTETVFIATVDGASSLLGLVGATLRKYDGTTLGTSTGSPIYVGVLPMSNRLVQAGFGNAGASPTGSNGSRSTVFFSDPGAPETYGANNYVHLQPGDGENIQAVVNWREYLFVFKRSTMFVFSTVSVNALGNPTFDYRTINLPDPLPAVSLTGAEDGYVCTGRDGVYFSTPSGIYRTNGGEASLVSTAVGPLFDGSSTLSRKVPDGRARLSWVANRLYASYVSTDSLTTILVWDSGLDEWMLWSLGGGLAATTLTRLRLSTGTNVVALAYASSVYYFSSASTSEINPSTRVVDQSLSSYYQAGWTDLGAPNNKRVRELGAWGSGAPTLSMFTDRGSTDTSSASVTLGTAPAVTRAVHRKAKTGREFSWKVSATSGAWNLSSLELYVADQRVT